MWRVAAGERRRSVCHECEEHSLRARRSAVACRWYFVLRSHRRPAGAGTRFARTVEWELSLERRAEGVALSFKRCPTDDARSGLRHFVLVYEVIVGEVIVARR